MIALSSLSACHNLLEIEYLDFAQPLYGAVQSLLGGILYLFQCFVPFAE